VILKEKKCAQVLFNFEKHRTPRCLRARSKHRHSRHIVVGDQNRMPAEDSLSQQKICATQVGVSIFSVDVLNQALCGWQYSAHALLPLLQH
jgi:hypothetical protein